MLHQALLAAGDLQQVFAAAAGVGCTLAILTGHGVQPVHVLVDLLSGAGLFVGGGGNLLGQGVYALQGLIQLAEGGQYHLGFLLQAVGLASGGAHHLQGLAGGTLQGLGNGDNFFGGAAGALGQVAHLVGDHGKAAALLAGTGGLNGGIQGQQVGLLGDAADHGED